jgi:hypothetical protein
MIEFEKYFPWLSEIGYMSKLQKQYLDSYCIKYTLPPIINYLSKTVDSIKQTDQIYLKAINEISNKNNVKFPTNLINKLANPNICFLLMNGISDGLTIQCAINNNINHFLFWWLTTNDNYWYKEHTDEIPKIVNQELYENIFNFACL